MEKTTIYSVDYRSPPSGDGVIYTPDGRSILLTSDGNACGSPDCYSEIRHFPLDPFSSKENMDLWKSFLQFIFNEHNVKLVHDSEFNYEGDRGHLINKDGNITLQNWLNTLFA